MFPAVSSNMAMWSYNLASLPGRNLLSLATMMLYFSILSGSIGWNQFPRFGSWWWWNSYLKWVESIGVGTNDLLSTLHTPFLNIRGLRDRKITPVDLCLSYIRRLFFGQRIRSISCWTLIQWLVSENFHPSSLTSPFPVVRGGVMLRDQANPVFLEHQGCL